MSQSDFKPIDPGAEFSKPRASKLDFIIGFVDRHPAGTLAGGEGKLLVDEIRRLEKIEAQLIATGTKITEWSAGSGFMGALGVDMRNEVQKIVNLVEHLKLLRAVG